MSLPCPNAMSVIRIPSDYPADLAARAPAFVGSPGGSALAGAALSLLLRLEIIARLDQLRRARELGEGLLFFEPGLVFALLLDDDLAAHRRVADAAELGAQDVEGAGPRRGEPEIGHEPRDHVHLRAELGHVEIVQHVDRAQQLLHRLAAPHGGGARRPGA